MILLVLALNALWFGNAFRIFSLKHQGAARNLLVVRSDRNAPLVASLAALLRFLGGMNGALFVFSVAVMASLAFESSLFDLNGEVAVVLFVLGLAHFSQFWFNVPVLRTHAVDPAQLWSVLSGPMLRIFVGDGFLAALNAVAAIWLVVTA